MPSAVSAPTAATPQPRPSACQSTIAAAGDLRGQRAAASADPAGMQATAKAARTNAAGRTSGHAPALPLTLLLSSASRARRSAVASVSDTLRANLARAAWRSPVCSSAFSMSSVT